MSRGAVGIEIELAFLDAVFHLAAGAVELLVEVAGLVHLAPQRSDDKPRIGFAAGPFRLGDDPTLAAPTLERPPSEVFGSAAPASRRVGSARAAARSSVSDLGVEARVLGQAEQEVDAVILAPRHERVAGEARIGAQQDARLGPAPADLGDDPRRLLDAAGTGVDVGRAQFGRQ